MIVDFQRPGSGLDGRGRVKRKAAFQGAKCRIKFSRSGLLESNRVRDIVTFKIRVIRDVQG